VNLVTGATGIIGSHVALYLLQQGKPVLATKRLNSDVNQTRKVFACYKNEHLFEKLKWTDVELTDIYSIEDALEGVDTVYHCAGYVSFNKHDQAKLKLLNETATANVVNACISKQVKNLCHVSSIAAINNNDYSGKLSEEVFWKTSGLESYYAISKYNAEREVWRGAEEGLNICIVNPGVVLSPVFTGQSSGNLIALCKKGNAFYTDGKTVYVAAPDVAKAMAELMDKQIYNERFIIAENHYTHLQILSIIQKAFHQKPPHIKIGKNILQCLSFIEALAGVFSKRQRRLNKETIMAALDSKEYATDKLTNRIPFSYTPINEYVSFIASC
jgi:dihydroflavonol-4-reductase